jgi:apoptosis-inducing factor 3
MAENDKGPDLAKGIPSGDLKEGAMLAGHVGDAKVLVVRRGGTVSALAAECTHYHGPLAEGLVVGDTIRCPWHHACFSIATGEALAAPALDPLACYVVSESEGRIVVGGKK